MTPLFACCSAASALIDAVEDFLSRHRVKAILISRVMTMASSGDVEQRRVDEDKQNIWERTKIHRGLRDDHDGNSYM